MLANYGYEDGSGVYYLTINTDKCNACGKCAEVCPNDVLEMVVDDYDETVPIVKETLSNQIGYICQRTICLYKCEEVCEPKAICHSW